MGIPSPLTPPSGSESFVCARTAALLLAVPAVLAGGCRSEEDRAAQAPVEDQAAQITVEEQGGDSTLTALSDTLLPGLERISRLDALRPIVVERRSAEQVRAFVEHQLDDRLPADELEGFRATYALLGLIPDTLDLRALLLDLYTEQIVGYYDPAEKKLFVVDGVPPDAVRPVLAHELVHALQDQHTNLDSLIAPGRGNDRQLAAQAAIEGHATLVMFSLLAEAAANRPVDPATLPNLAEQLGPALESPSSDFPVFRSAPRVVRETLLFPYSGGLHFVQELWRAQGEPRAAPLDSLLPQSTEQVLEPVARFIDERDEPTELRFEDDGASAAVYENGLGQLETRLFLEEHLGVGARSAAEGWDGDRYRLVRSPDGDESLIWYSVWDDDASADRFLGRLTDILTGPLGGNGTAERVSIDGRPGVRAVVGRTAHISIPNARVVASD